MEGFKTSDGSTTYRGPGTSRTSRRVVIITNPELGKLMDIMEAEFCRYPDSQLAGSVTFAEGQYIATFVRK
jgi:hypothetical protein